ncbi:unnamed protein product [Lactuca saligna]|uniref:Uncharacterized protein n=1 Tax=Lactuca saligna TaxID=75948 RepID=A0AA35Y9M0_LACSI|nr:unnamed protein product [Lactuca saligna]
MKEMYVHWRRERVRDIEVVKELGERRRTRERDHSFSSKSARYREPGGVVVCVILHLCVNLRQIPYVLQSSGGSNTVRQRQGASLRFFDGQKEGEKSITVRVWVCAILNLVVEVAVLMNEDSTTMEELLLCAAWKLGTLFELVGPLMGW